MIDDRLQPCQARRWRAGGIPGYRLGSNVLRFSPDEVVAWLEAEVLVDLEGNIEG
jgi:hypothetical protein